MTTKCKEGNEGITDESRATVEEARAAYYCGNYEEASLALRRLQVPAQSVTSPLTISFPHQKRRVQRLAIEADEVLCQLRACLTASKSRDHDCHDQDHTVASLLFRARHANETYRHALLQLLQWRLQQQKTSQQQTRSHVMSLTPQCKATVEGILMALVSAIWLYGKQENLEAGLWYVAREVYNLCSLLVSSLQLSVSIGTRKDLVDTLESLLSPPGNRAFDTFRHSWDAARWMCDRNSEQRSSVAKRQADQQHRCSATSGQCHNGGGTLQVHQLLFRAMIIDASINYKRINKDPILDDGLRQQRDQYLKDAALVESMIGRPCNKNIAANLSILMRASEAVNGGTLTGTEFEKLSNELSGILGNGTTDAAKRNLLGCLLAHSCRFGEALQEFQEVLRMDPNRSETIANVGECFLCIGETQRASEIWKCENQRLTYSGDDNPGLERLHPTVYSISPQASDRQLHRRLVLWRLFVCSSLINDTEWLLRSADTLRHYDSDFAELTNLFALLQTGRPSLALTTLQNIEQSKTNNSLLNVCRDLYKADAILETEVGGQRGILGISSLFKHSQFDRFQWRLAVVTTPDSTQREMRAILNNNRGISFILDGNVHAATSCFQESCNLLGPIMAKSKNRTTPIALLPPFFNLALIYWKEHKIKDAIDIWGEIRGISSEILSGNDAVNARELENLGKSSARAFLLLNPDTSSSLHVPLWGDLVSMKKQIFLFDSIILQSAAERQQQQFLVSWANVIVFTESAYNPREDGR